MGSDHMALTRQLAQSLMDVRADLQGQLSPLPEMRNELVELRNKPSVQTTPSPIPSPVVSQSKPEPKFPKQPDQAIYTKWLEERTDKLEEIQRHLTGNAHYFAGELKGLSGELTHCTEWLFSPKWSQQIDGYLPEIDRIVFAPLRFDSEMLLEKDTEDTQWRVLHNIEVELRFYRRQLEKYLARNGFERINIELGRTKFDPYLHTDGPSDRIATPDASRDNVIVRVRENGFMRNGRVLRTASVMREILQEALSLPSAASTSTEEVSSSDSRALPENSSVTASVPSIESVEDYPPVAGGMTEIIPTRKRSEPQ